MKFVYYNDTGREVSIHLGTKDVYKVECDMSTIQPLQERVFYLPDNTYPWVKMWDYGEQRGLSILVIPQTDE